MPGEFESILTKLQGKLGKQTVRRASTINRPRPKREVQQIQIFNEFNRRNPRADGGSVNGSYEAALRKKIEELMDEGYEFGEAVREAMRQGYQDGGQTMVQQANELGISKSALRKPFAPEIEKQIIKLHQVDKLGAQAIADKLGLSRAPVGKRITALKKEGKIKEVPYAERKAAIDQRGEFFGKPAGEKFQKIREVRDIDRTTKYKVGPQAGQLKYNIPKNAKFKIDFKNPGAALVSEIPDNLQGVHYYKTKKAAEKALAKRKSLQLLSPSDRDWETRAAPGFLKSILNFAFFGMLYFN
jgi:biotin operon repressor